MDEHADRNYRHIRYGLAVVKSDKVFAPKEIQETYEGPHCKNGNPPCGARTFYCPYFDEFLCSIMCDEE